MKEFITKSAAETSKVAALLGTKILSGAVIAFTGDLGAGKTTFIKGLAKTLGYVGEVSSPTFAIVHEYIGGRLPLYHFDMYRVESWESLYSTGFFEYMETDAVLAVEWSENIVISGNCLYGRPRRRKNYLYKGTGKGARLFG